MSDMLVKLYDLEEQPALFQALQDKGIRIERVLSPDIDRVIQFIQDHFQEGWVSESKAAFSNHPISCYIAIQEHQVIGFACYDATAKNYFGPTGVLESKRGNHIGYALLLKCLLSMREDGYGYAVIGWAEAAAPFYQRCVNAVMIEDSFPGIYKRLVQM